MFFYEVCYGVVIVVKFLFVLLMYELLLLKLLMGKINIF